jgi:hypothetical protein
MAGIMLSRARAILAALTFACYVAVPPAVAETVLRIANLAEPESLDPHGGSSVHPILVRSGSAHRERVHAKQVTNFVPPGPKRPASGHHWPV